MHHTCKDLRPISELTQASVRLPAPAAVTVTVRSRGWRNAVGLTLEKGPINVFLVCDERFSRSDNVENTFEKSQDDQTSKGVYRRDVLTVDPVRYLKC